MKKIQVFAIIFLCIRTVCSQLFPHIIWLYWDSGYKNLGRFQKLCYIRTKQLHEGTDWNIRFVQDKTLPLWLNKTNFKRYQQGTVQIANGFYPQSKADLVRYFLLKQHGGVWLDVSIVLKQNLDWLDNLLQNPRILHRNIFQKPQVFIHYQHWSQLKQITKIKISGYDYYPLFQIQNAFIAAVPESRYMNDLITQFQHILRQRQPYYNQVRYDFNIPNEYSAYFASFRACLVNQYRKYVQYQDALHQNKPIENLKNHFYNVLALNRDIGMYHGSINEWRVRQFLLYQQGRFGDFQNYLMKFSRGPSHFLAQLLQNSQKKQQDALRWLDRDVYEFGQKYLPQKYDSLYKSRIHEGSAINKYFLHKYAQVKRLFPKTQILKQSEVPIICKFITLKTFMWSYPLFFQWVKTACLIIAFAQLLFQYYVLYFQSSKEFFSDLKFLRYRIYTKVLIITAIYLQKDLIYSQYQLWMQYSPTAVLVGTVQLILTLTLFKWFKDIDLNSSKKNKYWIRIIFAVLFQYYFMYIKSVWKYQGQIYSYEILAQLNKKKLQEGVVHLIKILSLMGFTNIFTFLRWFFRICLIQNTQPKEQQFLSIKRQQQKEQNLPSPQTNIQYLSESSMNLNTQGQTLMKEQ